MKQPNNKSTRTQHISFGIRKWLKEKGFTLNEEQYFDLLMEYGRQSPGFIESKIKSLETIESYVDKRFANFCSYCGIKLKKQK